MELRRILVSLETIYLGVRVTSGSKVNELPSILSAVIPENVRLRIGTS